MAEKKDANRQRGLRGINLAEIVNSGVQEGVDAIIKKRPRFEDQEDLLLSYIDTNKIRGEIKDYLDKNKGATINYEDLLKHIASYVASGNSFKGKGKEIILRTALEEKSKKWWNFGASEIFEGEKYLDETMASFRDLYHLLKTGDYARRMPELSKAVTEIYDMGFADSALNVLYENNLFEDKKKYMFLKRAIRERAKQSATYVKGHAQKSLEDYIIPQKAAAVVLGIIGIASLIANNSITGNAVGISSPDIFGLLGGVLLVISAGLLWFVKKKQVKYKTRRKPNIKNKKKEKKR